MAIFYNFNKRNFTLLLLFIALKIGFSQTTISGGSVFGHWPLSGSPYIINGSIYIPNDSTLTVDPGVTVNFQGTYRILVLGRLLALGTLNDSITFTASNITNGWKGIRFDNTTNNNDTTKIYYCKIEYCKAVAPDDNGGAFYFRNFSKAIISNSFICNSSASNNGGGIYCEFNSSPIILNNTIVNNISGNGAGIYCNDAINIIISNNNISNNTAAYIGGGVYLQNNSTISNNIISNNIISNNTANNAGGGIYSQNNTPIILNNTISNNICSFFTSYSEGGGGINLFNCGGNIAYNIISNNTASDNGGGLCCHGGSIPTISNNVITNNSGSGIYCSYGSSPIIENNTISKNSAINGGGLYCSITSNPIIRNTIFYDNTASTDGQQIYLQDEGSDPSFYYCDVQGGASAFGLNNNINIYLGSYQNNIDTDPLFVSPSGGSGTAFDGLIADWSLQVGSPCIDAGNPTGTYALTDIAGNPRVAGAYIDMGAYESPSISTNVNEINFASKTNLYPNPSSGSFKIKATDGVLSKIEVVDLLGKVVYSNAFQQNNSNNEIELENPEKGVYFAKYTISSANQGAESVFTEKIVIQ